MLRVELVGSIAGFLTTVSFVPQVVQIIRTRNVTAISVPMYCALILGLCLWLLYGMLLGRQSIIIANTVTLVLASLVLGLKIAFERHRRI